jgi:uncharacterized protein (DUF2235 family)
LGGQGIHADIQNAYHFLCLNYQPGDEIHLVGFSRGAFTVRALACFIADFGILCPTHLAVMQFAYKKWESRDNTALATLERYAAIWAKDNQLRRNIQIQTCAVWDTVNSTNQHKLKFVEQEVPQCLKNAFQALALHETRNDFLPVLWKQCESSKTNVRETWFAGDHTDIGGGHADCGLATLTLLWMLAQFVEFTNASFEEVIVLDYMTPMLIRNQLEKDSYPEVMGKCDIGTIG